MIDYTAIANGDPGGDLTTAFSVMKAETITVAADKMCNYISVAREVGFAVAAALESRVNELISAGAFPSWLKAALENDGININDPQVAGLVASLVDGSTFTQTQADAILAMSQVLSDKYPNLKEGYLQDARRKRAGGLI